MGKQIKYEGLTLTPVDGKETLQISVDNSDDANQCETTYLNKNQVGELVKDLQRIYAKMV